MSYCMLHMISLRTISHISITFQDYLSLIPSIRNTFAPPFIGKTTQHMRNNYGDQKGLNNNGNKNVQLASFRILHIPDLSDGAQAVLPFIFILKDTIKFNSSISFLNTLIKKTT